MIRVNVAPVFDFMPPALFAVAGQTTTLLAAGAGGAVLAFAGFPAAWLSGAMIVSALIAASGRGRPMLTGVRDFALLISGITMGTGVTPATLTALAAVPLSLVLLVAAIVVIMAASAFLLIRVFGWNRMDAMLASVPGALSSILVIAHDQKADVPAIACVQLFRLVMLIAVLPSVLVAGNAGPMIAQDPQAMSLVGILVLFAAALPAGLLLHRFRVPAALLLGGMLATGVLTGSGVIDGRFPGTLASFGFMLIGAFIGERFRGMRRADFVRLLPAAVASFIVATVIAAAFAEAAALLLGVSQAAAFLAFAPGGLEAMAILAFTLAIDPVYVAAHHLARFLFIGISLPVAFKASPAFFGARRDDAQR